MPSGPVTMKDLPPGWTAADETAFRQWYAPIAKAQQLDANPDDPQHHYNYRLAFKAGALAGPDGHWPSAYKDATHPNRFVNGQDTTMPDQTISPEDAALLEQIKAAQAGKRKMTFALASEQPPADQRSTASKFAGGAVKSVGNAIAGLPDLARDIYAYGSGDMGAKMESAMRFQQGLEGLYDQGKRAFSGDPEAMGNFAGQAGLALLTRRFAPGVGRVVGRAAPMLNRMMPAVQGAEAAGAEAAMAPMASPTEIAAKLYADDAIRQPTTRLLGPGPSAPKMLPAPSSIQLPESSLTALGRQAGKTPGTFRPAPGPGPRIASILDEPPVGTQLPGPGGLDQLSGYGLGRYADNFNPEADFYRPVTPVQQAQNALAEAVLTAGKKKAKK